MTDIMSKEQRSKRMQRIKGKDTSIELLVRQYLFKKGYRFRKNDGRYQGKPDVVLPKYNTIVFIHGCFWHRHNGCKYAQMPKSNIEFWQKKFDRNVENDNRNKALLEEQGWNVITIWECEIKNHFQETMDKVEMRLNEAEKQQAKTNIR